ncbi:hypothetical protein ACCT06_10650 [Rhizobium ruizarguesonis]
MRQVILAENIDRRHLTKEQRAMAVAMMYPEPEKMPPLDAAYQDAVKAKQALASSHSTWHIKRR